MDLLAEYKEMSALPNHIAVTYKFFSMFKIDGDTMTWAGHETDISTDTNTKDALKAFLKAQRSALREGGLSASECSKRMWFWFQKLLELDLFEGDGRQEILKWMEVCELIVC